MSNAHLNSKWFVGVRTRMEAERALQFAPPGAFCVRDPPAGSTTSTAAVKQKQRYLILSHKLATGRIAHSRIVIDATTNNYTVQVSLFFFFFFFFFFASSISLLLCSMKPLLLANHIIICVIYWRHFDSI
jgi:hypothetical protein